MDFTVSGSGTVNAPGAPEPASAALLLGGLALLVVQCRSRLRHRPGVERRERVAEAPVLGPGLLAAAGDVQHEAEQLPADLLDGGIAGGDAAGVDIDQIVPFFGERGARRDLDDGTSARPYGLPSPVVKTCRFMDASCCVPQMKSLAGVAAKTSPLAVTSRRGRPRPSMARAARFGHDAERLLDDVGEAAAFVAGRGIGAAVGVAARQIFVVPAHLADQGAARPPALTARGVSRCMASRTSVTSENMTVAPARTRRSAA